jgi:hypothetical protein
MKLLLTLLTCLPFFLLGQRLKNFDLNDMSGFRDQAGNWKIVSDVKMNRSIDVHKEGNGSIITKDGSGILINLNDESKKSALLSKMEHGDIDLEFEFMMPRGSNSGLYLMGRYEVQLYDSWGVITPSSSDLGGIYRNWETEKGKIYMGKAPMSNPAKAPGLWQKMEVSFKAPKFDTSGKKIKNAKINLAKINGVVIHENIEIPLPTGGPIENNEVAKGPLMIQGDHGAVAIRNIKYRLIEDKAITVGATTFQAWDGSYFDSEKYKNLAPLKQGRSTDGLTWKVSDKKNEFAIKLQTELEIPQQDNYEFSIIANGFLTLNIDGKEVYKAKDELYPWSNAKTQSISLSKGKHNMELYLSKTTSWVEPNLAIFIEGDEVARQQLHNFNSYIETNTRYPIFVDNEKPTILRAFLDFNNDNKQRRTHTIAVGSPTKVNYIFDNANGALSCIWKGGFIDASPMWFDRGDGSFKPMGSPIYLFDQSQFKMNGKAAIEADLDHKEFRSRGYKIYKETQTPIFNYEIFGMKVSDKLYHDVVSNMLTRELELKDKKSGLGFLLAKGKVIEKLDDNNYIIDNQYYIQSTQTDLSIKTEKGEMHLISAMSGDKINYSIIW